eukprot:SAG11_NODE_2634_length_3150_cov_44.903966_2_plen_91_part_00
MDQHSHSGHPPGRVLDALMGVLLFGARCSAQHSWLWEWLLDVRAVVAAISRADKTRNTAMSMAMAHAWLCCKRSTCHLPMIFGVGGKAGE